MKKTSDFNLISGLFSSPQQVEQAEQYEQHGQAKSAAPIATKRTFAINNEYWEDFVALAAANKMTNTALLNEVIKKAVEENTEKINAYREFFGDK